MSPTATITVSGHAVEQLRRRFRDRRPFTTVVGEIEEAVGAAIAAGRIANHLQPGFGLYGRKTMNLERGKRFVWTEDLECGWIVSRDPGPGDVTVLTTLSRSGVTKRGGG